MDEQKNNCMGACGLDCESCTIYRATFDREAPRNLLSGFFEGWLKEYEGAEEIMARAPFGLRGDCANHWSPNCGILKCCVGEKKHQHCAQCGECSCVRLNDWAASDPD